ncbi:MAG: FecR family protein [Bacteroidales bacterium]
MEHISKYIEDKKFIEWVFNSNEELETWWKTFETENQHEKENIQLAGRILNTLKTTDKELSEEEKIILFSRILRQIEKKQETGGKIKLLANVLKYTAVAILFFSIGALLFYRQDNFNPQFYSQQLTEPNSANEAKLIRPDGESILLEEQKSIIEYQNNGQVIVNNNVLEVSNPVKKGVPILNQLIIPYGKTTEILLPDGTKVFLNAGSRLIYPELFTDKNREVFLVGEAFFEVKQDNEHPFVVQTTDIRVRVQGTKFNISAYPSDNIIETVLTDGKVRIEQNNSGIFSENTDLIPNQLAAYSKSSREVKLFMIDPDNYTLWKDGLCKFESTDLSRIAKKLERFYNIRFTYRDPLLSTIKISGKLELSENKDEIINRLAIAASVKIYAKGENYYEINK